MEAVARFENLKKRYRELETELASKRALYEQAKRSFDKLLDEARDRYGVGSIDELRALLSSKEAELSKKISELESVLSEYEVKLK